MERRQLGVGVGTVGLGLAVFVLLAATGSLRHPATATEQTHPVEFLAIGAGFLLVTAGVLAAIAAYVEPSIDSS